LEQAYMWWPLKEWGVHVTSETIRPSFNDFSDESALKLYDVSADSLWYLSKLYMSNVSDLDFISMCKIIKYSFMCATSMRLIAKTVRTVLVKNNQCFYSDYVFFF
jgi:hypothetical protein